jgi:predicted acyltransferase
MGTFTETQPQITKAATAATRLMSLDVFRGMTIAAMILVNNAGDWDHVYWPLEHAAWNGWTPTDLIFAFFLFIVGVSMVMSFDARRRRGASRGQLLLHSLKRSATIFALGLFLNGYPHFNVHTIRIPGVLQRIAVVYFIASLIVLFWGRAARWLIAASLLIGYFLLMKLVAVPGLGVGVLTMDGNLAGYLDRGLMYNHLYIAHRFDPEGVLSTLPAIVTCLIGVFAGDWIRDKQPRQVVRGLIMGAAAGLTLGNLWNLWFPINKNLWTSSYVVFTGGFAMAVLAMCYWVVDVRDGKRWAQPFLWYGMNPLAIYFLASWLGKASVMHSTNGVRWKTGVYNKVFEHLFANPYWNSLAFAMGYVLLFWIVAWALYRKRIFIRV